jgi:hypothetical protein
MLIPTAETSFNYSLAGILIGAISGYLIKNYNGKKQIIISVSNHRLKLATRVG